MGIPRFYRWLSERYPLINEQITAEQIPEFDNLYLDMNGIIHNCSHNDAGGLAVSEESDIFVNAFKYICRLFQIIRPKRLIYMAIDGCAPRAKMNQQRSRRFRAANDAREAREKAEEMGEDTSGASHFDSNCITPGTEFMAKLTEHLCFFIYKKMQEDPLWQGVEVVLSGPETPGEGEHKIMDYIRTMKAQPDFDPNQRHCLYGLDADLIMLALASHEPHFALLREEVVFGKRVTESVEKRMLISKDRFQLLHISLVREYLDLEFASLKSADLPFTYTLERLIDDFILFCALVGNDFLPCLPFAEIGEGGLEDLFNVFKDHFRSADTANPWLTSDCGVINFDQLAKFCRKYAEIENSRLEAVVEEQNFILGTRRMVGPSDAPDPPDKSDGMPNDPPPTAELARVQYYEVKFSMDIDTHEGTQQRRHVFQSYLEGLQWVMYYYFQGPDRASWSWYYPYYHSPMLFDVAQYDKLSNPGIKLEVGGPFKPFQQLMGVLPYNSKTFLPQCYHWLFESPESPILSFYPKKFEVDMDGVRVPWGGVTLISFIDPSRLLEAMAEAERRGPPLTEAEKKRNSFQIARSFRFNRAAKTSVASTLPHKFKDLTRCPVTSEDFTHPQLPTGVKHFINDLLPGCKLEGSGFPTLHVHPLTHTFEAGIKVFQFESRSKGMIVHFRPDRPIVPTEQAVAQLLKAPSAQIDFPFVHRGKIIAVHTAHAKYLPNGKTIANNPGEHENLVWNLLQEWRRKGLCLNFNSSSLLAAGDAAAGRARASASAGQGSCSEQELWQQPLVEVRAAESSYLDSEGRPQLRFQATTELRLLHLVKPEEVQSSTGSKTIAERFPAGTSVVCIEKHCKVFGQMGAVAKSSNDAGSLEAMFEVGLSQEEQEALQLELLQVVERQHASLKWYGLSDFAQQVELEIPVVRAIVGSMFARCADNVREDIGMNLVSEPKGEGVPLCLPCYSMKAGQDWFFSDLAVEALRDYFARFPKLFAAIPKRRNPNQDLEQRFIFPDSPDVDYASRQLIKYVGKCPFKKLRLAPVQYMAMMTSGVLEVVEAVDKAIARLASSTETETVRGYRRLYKAEDAGSRPPAELFPGEDLMVGQRGIYIKPHGLVPCGAKGTIIGIYGSGASQEVELILDEDSFGGTDLHGRSLPMRGLQVPSSAFLPLFPRLNASGGLTTTQVIEELAASQDGGRLGVAPRTESGAKDWMSNNDRATASAMLFSLLRSPDQGPAADPMTIPSSPLGLMTSLDASPGPSPALSPASRLRDERDPQATDHLQALLAQHAKPQEPVRKSDGGLMSLLQGMKPPGEVDPVGESLESLEQRLQNLSTKENTLSSVGAASPTPKSATDRIKGRLQAKLSSSSLGYGSDSASQGEGVLPPPGLQTGASTPTEVLPPSTRSLPQPSFGVGRPTASAGYPVTSSNGSGHSRNQGSGDEAASAAIFGALGRGPTSSNSGTSADERDVGQKRPAAKSSSTPKSGAAGGALSNSSNSSSLTKRSPPGLAASAASSAASSKAASPAAPDWDKAFGDLLSLGKKR
ncbi:unnamed protein product [Polarella glacialis]|uniref:Uncharacterized protein n=1 Tax=Polarella glacialis TaxID=89957 RepID=A0A813EXB2_POLGL|nr:unnamed protein product [Polarella glacialis]